MATRIDREGWEQRLRALGIKGKLPAVLTQGVVDATQKKPLGVRYSLADGSVLGLRLQVNETGAASYLLHYRRAGKLRHFGLGSARAVTLAKAREEAEDARTARRKGHDPIEDEKARRMAEKLAQSNTLRAYLTEVYGPKVLAHHKDGGAPKARKPDADPKPSGTWARILFAWEPLLPVELAALSRDAIEKMLAERKAEGKQAGTLIRDWGALRALLADAVDRGHLAAVPMARRPEPIRKLQGNKRIRYLGQRDTPDTAPGEGEAERFAKALAAFTSDEPGGGDFLRCVAQLALATGMRRGEVVRLTDKIVNVRERRIDLTPEVTKSNKARTVHLSDDALAALKLWKLRDGKTGALFPGDPERWEDRITQREWPRLCAAAKLEDFHFHDLRHTFAARLVMAGRPLIEVRDALGHASIVMTERYAHLAPSRVRDAVLELGRRAGG
jgi:integrase